jgi:hypothetical protein
MSAKQRKLLWPVIIAVAISFTALSLWASVRAKTDISGSVSVAPPALATPTPQSSPGSQVDLQSKLARQPEVFKLNRLLGQRLKGRKPATSVLIGTLTRGSDEQGVRITRRQNESGEGVEITIGNSESQLTWDAAEGAKSPGDALTGNERLLVERLVLDSPDQFVLAQLRGASYYTVARNVRPEQATEEYTGPLWNIVRVGDPAAEGVPGRWRLYYLNTVTGLIDKIISQEQDGSVVAELTGWTTVNGEKVPSHITWSRQGQVIMQFALTNFSSGN